MLTWFSYSMMKCVSLSTWKVQCPQSDLGSFDKLLHVRKHAIKIPKFHVCISLLWGHGVAWSHGIYRQTSHTSGTLIGDKTVDHFWSIACRRCSSYIFILYVTHGFNGLGKDNWKTRRETFNFGNLVQLILKVWRHSFFKKGEHIQTALVSIFKVSVLIYVHVLVCLLLDDKPLSELIATYNH